MNKRLKRLYEGKNRGNNLIPIFEKEGITPEKATILDVGCGRGALTLDFARKFRKVCSFDASEDGVKITKERVEKKRLKNVTIYKDNALNMKHIKGKFDVIHLSGVFEWLRLGNMSLKASEAQDLFLKNIKKYLRNDSSILYSGTENKLFPYFWVKDPHFNGWPFMVLLPEKFSDAIAKMLSGRKYPPKIYSYWTLKKLYKKHFKEVHFYVPIPHYQYVFAFADINNKKEIIQKSLYVLKNYKLDRLQRLTTYWILWSARLNLIKLFTPGFITIAKKPKLRD